MRVVARYFTLGLLVLCLFGWPGRSEAAGDKPLVSLAMSSYRKGMVLLRQKQYAKALLVFSTARRLLKGAGNQRGVRSLTYLMALCRYYLGRLIPAMKGFRAYLNTGKREAWLKESSWKITQIQRRLAARRLRARQVKQPKRVKQSKRVPKGATKSGGTGNHAVTRKRTSPPSKSKPVAARKTAVPTTVAVKTIPARSPPPAPARPGAGYTHWIVLGLGAVAVATGSAFLVAGQSAKADRDRALEAAPTAGSTSADSQTIVDLHGSAQTRFAVGWAAIGTGVVAAGLGTWLLLRRRRSGAPRKGSGGQARSIALSPGPSGLALGGTF